MACGHPLTHELRHTADVHAVFAQQTRNADAKRGGALLAATIGDFGEESRIGYSEQMGQMCEHMGAGAPGFTELALKFHHTADKIGEAAKKHDAEGVLSALSETLATCTSCHQAFKQQVVDDAAWTALTKRAAPLGPNATR